MPAYAVKYVSLVQGDDVMLALRSQIDDTVSALQSFGEERAGNLRYEPGKWTPKEVLNHIADCERVFQYRLLRFGRGDLTPLGGFNENVFAANTPSNARGLSQLIADYKAVRQSTLSLLESFSAEAWDRTGEANGHTISVRGLAFLTAGHELHHLNILRERYR